MTILWFIPLIIPVFIKEHFFLGPYISLDRSCAFMLFIFPLIYILVRSCRRYTGDEGMHLASLCFPAVLLLLGFSFCSYSAFLFLAFLEASVIFIVLYIFWFSKDRDKRSSTLFILFTNRFPSILFMYFSRGFIFKGSDSLGRSLSFFLFVCFTLLLLSKLPIFLLHFWLTKAHVRAPGPGSIVLASLMLKIGGMGLYKFTQAFRHSIVPLFFCLTLPLVGGVYLLVNIFRFTDLKHLVACSSVAHIGLTLPFLIEASPVGVFSSMLMLVGHGLISYFVFFIVRDIYESTQNKSFSFTKSLESINQEMGLVLRCFFIFNLGFPPFITFLREVASGYLVYSLSMYLFSPFIITLILAALVFFIVVSKFLFGKKSNLCLFGSSPYMYFYAFVYFRAFVLTTFLYFCFSSLF